VDSDYQGCKILLVEDEESLAVGLEYNLKEEGYRVKRASDGKSALEMYQSEKFDLIILDIMLPYIDGLQVAERIRKKSPQLPILILTAKTTPEDKVHGLEIGVDDYLTKPFHLKELLLRVRGMLKRKAWYRQTVDKRALERIGKFEMNFDTMICTAPDKKIQLTHLEASLLRYFIDNEGRVISRTELLENVWNIDSSIETRTVDNFIARFRKYFEDNPAKPVHFKNIRGAGYLFSRVIL
jgi:two-component system, OmpR family, alkaline phosphatase synthesis response regulator PhoP